MVLQLRDNPVERFRDRIAIGSYRRKTGHLDARHITPLPIAKISLVLVSDRCVTPENDINDR